MKILLGKVMQRKTWGEINFHLVFTSPHSHVSVELNEKDDPYPMAILTKEQMIKLQKILEECLKNIE